VHLDLDAVSALVGGKIGMFDVACPLCGPTRQRAINRHRKVLRVWRDDAGFATYHCARCGEHGHVRDESAPRQIDRAAMERAKAETEERERASAADRLKKAAWLWARSKPAEETPVENYLRNRGYEGPISDTLRYLPPRGDHAPAMIAPFGMASEIKPGAITMRSGLLRGIHLTRLLPDGSGKIAEHAKIMVGASKGWPIVVAPPNDLLALAITEGIEDALSAHAATGIGAWAAGSGSRMPELAEAVPSYIETVTIFAHADPAGRKGSTDLAELLIERGVETYVEGLQ